MLGGIIFILVVWILPLIIWYFVQGRKEFNSESNCESVKKEKKWTKISFLCALGVGVLLIILVIIVGS